MLEQAQGKKNRAQRSQKPLALGQAIRAPTGTRRPLNQGPPIGRSLPLLEQLHILIRSSIYLSIYLSVYLSMRLSVCLSVCLSVSVRAGPSSVYVSVSLSICLFLYLYSDRNTQPEEFFPCAGCVLQPSAPA